MKKFIIEYKINVTKKRRFFIATKSEELRINEQIKAAKVRVIGEKGEQVGVLSLVEARAKAEELGVDLVEVSPEADPPVCRLINYGKFLYQKEKKAKEARKKQKVIEIKEMKFRPKIDNHDFEYRIKQIKEFLEKGDKVKITIRFRGRELVHSELGFELAKRIVEQTKDLGAPEKSPRMEGRNIVFVISAIKKQ